MKGKKKNGPKRIIIIRNDFIDNPPAMQLSYDGELGYIYVKLNDTDIATLQKENNLENEEGHFLLLDDAHTPPEPVWEKDKISGIGISPQLLDLFLDIQKEPKGRACVERIGTMLSVELLQQE